MNHKIRNIAISLGLSVAFGGSMLLAQSDRAESANVPFAFHVKQTSLEAGKYRVDLNTNGTIKMINLETRKTIVFMSGGATQTSGDERKLVFHRYGNSYFLSEIWLPNQREYSLPKGALEKEMSHGNGMVAMVTIPAERQ